MKLGILGTSDIAFRRFLPALRGIPEIEYCGVASRTPPKGEKFVDSFGGKVYSSYDDLINDENIDIVYIPLPPSLHFEWGKKAIIAGKHILMEKPCTDSFEHTKEIITLAREKNVIIHENYMFLYHSQLKAVKKMLQDGTVGDIRVMRMSFGFPLRQADDFRYKKELGGGALLDCGGYPVRLALELMGNETKVVYSQMKKTDGYDVDMYGNVTLTNKEGVCAQVSYGMDNAYQCSLEIWGKRATLYTNRIFTAGVDYLPTLTIRTSTGEETLNLEADDQFRHSIEYMIENIKGNRQIELDLIIKQANLIESIRRGTGNDSF